MAKVIYKYQPGKGMQPVKSSFKKVPGGKLRFTDVNPDTGRVIVSEQDDIYGRKRGLAVPRRKTTRKTGHSHRTRTVQSVPRRANASMAVRKTATRGQSRPTASYRSRRSGGPRALTNRSVGPCPDRYFCTLKWGEAYTLSGVVANRQVWAGNNAGDPNLGVGNSEPIGWDQLQQFYAQYLCHSSHIILKITNQSATAAEWVLYPRVDTTAAPASYLEARQNEHAIWGVVGAQTSGHDVVTVKHKMMTKTLYGETTIESNPQYIGLMGVSGAGVPPPQQWYWQLCMISTDGAVNVTATVDIAMLWKLEFKAARYLPIPTA